MSMMIKPPLTDCVTNYATVQEKQHYRQKETMKCTITDKHEETVIQVRSWRLKLGVFEERKSSQMKPGNTLTFTTMRALTRTIQAVRLQEKAAYV